MKRAPKSRLQPKTSAPLKKSLAKDWDGSQWKDRCAWCSKQMPEDEQVFAISVHLRPEAIHECAPGSIQPLYLHPAGHVAPMIILDSKSPAKADGQDALFQLCSKPCAEALGKALKEALG